ncbi:hypothetical protein ACA910_006621 [Epithemia clementina (nom. ined.)]
MVPLPRLSPNAARQRPPNPRLPPRPPTTKIRIQPKSSSSMGITTTTGCALAAYFARLVFGSMGRRTRGGRCPLAPFGTPGPSSCRLANHEIGQFSTLLDSPIATITLGRDDGQPHKLQVELLLNLTQDNNCKADKNDPNNNSDNNKNNNKNKNINIIDLAKYKAPGGPQPGEDLVPNDDDHDHEGGSRDATMSTAVAASFSSKAVAAATVAAAAAAVLNENAHELIFLEFLPQTGLDGRRGQQRRSGHGVGLRTQYRSRYQ